MLISAKGYMILTISASKSLYSTKKARKYAEVKILSLPRHFRAEDLNSKMS
jgi:hypothetical protein